MEDRKAEFIFIVGLVILGMIWLGAILLALTKFISYITCSIF